jgi:hypothetical protein
MTGNLVQFEFKKTRKGEKLHIIVEGRKFEGSDVSSVTFNGSGIFQVPVELFAKFEYLQYLAMSEQKVQVISPGTFEYADYLKGLKLSGNKIWILAADTFKEANNLKIIDLSKNLLESLPEGIFRTLPNLQEISSVFLASNISNFDRYDFLE